MFLSVCALCFHFLNDLGFELEVFFAGVWFVENVVAFVFQENGEHAVFALEALFAVFEIGAFPTVVAEV